MNRKQLWIKLTHSFWFIPFLYIIGAIFLAVITVNIDFSFSEKQLKTIAPNVLVPDAELSVKLLSTLVTATLTMTTITFSTIMVVLTTFSGQFSPRTMQNFLADRKTQNILALFIGGFAYDLVSFLQMKSPGDESLLFAPLFAVLIAIAGGVAFVYFINHIAKMVQVNHLIDQLSKEAVKTITRLDNDIKQFQQSINDTSSQEQKNLEKGVITAKHPGYIDLINFHALMQNVKSDNIKVDMDVFLGDYVVTGRQLLSYSFDPEQPDINPEKYRHCIKVSWERTGVQDIEFQIQKLEEIALRAISPSTNDPHTAINCINRMGEIFIRLGNKKWLQSSLEDNQNQKRLTIKQHDFSYYLYQAFYQIRHYAKEDVSTTNAILKVFKLIAAHTPVSTHETIWEYSNYVITGFNKDVLQPQDEELLEHELEEISRITGYHMTD